MTQDDATHFELWPNGHPPIDEPITPHPDQKTAAIAAQIMRDSQPDLQFIAIVETGDGAMAREVKRI